MHYHVKFPNFTIEGGRKQTTTNFSFSFKIWLELDSKNPTVGEFFLWLLRGHICVSFDNARTLNCYTLRRSKDVCLRKQVVYFNSF